MTSSYGCTLFLLTGGIGRNWLFQYVDIYKFCLTEKVWAFKDHQEDLQLVFFYIRLWVKLYYLKEIYKIYKSVEIFKEELLMNLSVCSRWGGAWLPVFLHCCALSLAPVSLYLQCCAVRSCLLLLSFPSYFFPFCTACFFLNTRVGVKPEEDTGCVAFFLSSIHSFILSTSVQWLFGNQPGLSALNVFFNASSPEPLRQQCLLLFLMLTSA